MKDMKMGTIVQILKMDGVGVIREEHTLTEWLFFLEKSKEKFQVGQTVIFNRDKNYEQFVAFKVKRLDSANSKLAM